MKKYRAKIVIRANERGENNRQLSDEDLRDLGRYKETEFEIIEAENIHKAADILVDKYLPPMEIDNPRIEVFFDQDFKG